MKKTVLILQTRTGLELGDFEGIEKTLLEKKPDFACLPEYFATKSKKIKAQHEEGSKALARLKKISAKVQRTVIVCGTVVEKNKGKFFSTCFILKSGRIIGRHRKVFLTKNELKRGLTAGRTFKTIKAAGLRLGFFICNDVLKPFSAHALAGKADLIFVPLLSPKRKNDPTAAWRDNLFRLRAFETGTYVVKVGSVGSFLGEKVVGRSIVASPWAILWKSENEEKPCQTLVSLDFNLLNKYRKTEPLYRY